MSDIPFKITANKKCLSAKERRWLRRLTKRVHKYMELPEVKEKFRKAYIDLAMYGRAEYPLHNPYGSRGTSPIEDALKLIKKLKK